MNGLLETEAEFLMCGIFSDGKKVKREHLVHFFFNPFLCQFVEKQTSERVAHIICVFSVYVF